MSGRWYKRCGADFIHGTMMLTLEEKGAYSLCLDLIYDRGGPIPDDARWLSGVCGVSIRKWNAIRDRLISLGKLTAENGLLSNVRAGFELVSSELQARERAESGAKGGRKRAENAAALNGKSHLAVAELKQPSKQIREEEKREEVSSNDDSPSDNGHSLRPEHVFEGYQELAASIGRPVPRDFTPERRQLVRGRITQYGLDDFQEVFAKSRDSPFLRGDKGRTPLTFDWLMKKGNFQKVLEGNYDQ